MRAAALAVACVALMAAPAVLAQEQKPQFVSAVEFPYYMIPANRWEADLVRLKAMGIRTVEFSIPWNWHQLGPSEFDFEGRTNPRRDLMGLLRTLRKLGLQAWVRPAPPVAGWRLNGFPEVASQGAGLDAWLGEIERRFAPQTVNHGGAIAYIEGPAAGRFARLGVPAPPSRVTGIGAWDPGAPLARSRETIAAAAGHAGALLWSGVEDEFYPAGWAANPVLTFTVNPGNEPSRVPDLRDVYASGFFARKGRDDASSAAGAALLRDAALLRNWTPLLADLRPVATHKPSGGKRPAGLRVANFVSAPASAVSITNTSAALYHGDVQAALPNTKRALVIPGVTVPAGESLWLPVALTLGPQGLCRECTNFSPAENIVYATAELTDVEYENGILAMEFAAPVKGEIVLQLARTPSGPYLAAGKPAGYDWDAQTLRARLPIPAGTGPGHRVRVGLAMEAPDATAFFNDAKRLLIGGANTISTVYSSPALAKRSRLKLPEGYTARAVEKSPLEIDYEVTPPADAVAGDFADLTLEADGAPLGRAHVELFRPLEVRLTHPIELHFGPVLRVAPETPIASFDPKGGSEIEIALRNNSAEIRTYHLEASGEGLEFLPPSADLTVGALAERPFAFRVFSAADAPALRAWRLRVSGGGEVDIAMRALALPHEGSTAWSADLAGDGALEWALESQEARAVFSAQDGGRWIEFTSKQAGVNFLPQQGEFAARGPVEVSSDGGALIFTSREWKRTVRLEGGAIIIEQTSPLPGDTLVPGKRAGATLSVERASPQKMACTITLEREQPPQP